MSRLYGMLNRLLYNYSKYLPTFWPARADLVPSFTTLLVSRVLASLSTAIYMMEDYANSNLSSDAHSCVDGTIFASMSWYFEIQFG